MLIKSDYRVFESVAGDDSRLTLTCVNVVSKDLDELFIDGFKPGLAMATDGFILAVVPVQIADYDQVGLVGRDAFKAAFDAARRMRIDPVEMKLDLPDYVGLADGSMVRRFENGVSSHDFGRFPDVSPVIPKRMKAVDREITGRHLMAANFNYAYALRLIKSIGCKWSDRGQGAKGDHFPRLVFGRVDGNGSTCEPIVVESQGVSMGEEFVPPFGILMPMHSSNQGNYWRQPSKKSRR